jgi:hypothetical protein
VRLDTTGDLTGSGIEPIELDACNQFTIQAEEFSRAVLEERPQPARLEVAVANMACIDAIFRRDRPVGAPGQGLRSVPMTVEGGLASAPSPFDSERGMRPYARGE